MKKIDLTNQRFTRLQVINEATPYIWQGKAKIQWNCQCNCGNTTIQTTEHLRSGHTTSCGCLGYEARKKAVTKHGCAKQGKKTSEYSRWQGIIKRCYNPSSENYKFYGGKGVTVCDQWRESFILFLADMGPCPTGYEIDRTDNTKGYAPGNCAWVTPQQNKRNMSNNHLVTINGETKLVVEWCAIFNINKHTVYQRIHRGWPEDQWFELTTKTRRKRQHHES